MGNVPGGLHGGNDDALHLGGSESEGSDLEEHGHAHAHPHAHAHAHGGGDAGAQRRGEDGGRAHDPAGRERRRGSTSEGVQDARKRTTKPLFAALRARETGAVTHTHAHTRPIDLPVYALDARARSLDEQHHQMWGHVVRMRALASRVREKGSLRNEQLHQLERLFACVGGSAPMEGGQANDADEMEACAVAFVRLGGIEACFDALDAMFARLEAELGRAQEARASQADRAHILMTGCVSILGITRETLYSLNERAGLSRVHWINSERALAMTMRFLSIRQALSQCMMACEEIVASSRFIPTIRGLARYGCDVLPLIMRMGPREIVFGMRLLAMMTFDPVAQDPSSPPKQHQMLQRARATATHFAERYAVTTQVETREGDRESAPVTVRVSVREVAGAERQQEAASTLLAQSAAPLHAAPLPCHSPWAVGVTPAVDENQALILRAGDGLVLYRLIQLLALPRAQDGAKEKALLVEQLHHALLATGIAVPLALLRQILPVADVNAQDLHAAYNVATSLAEESGRTPFVGPVSSSTPGDVPLQRAMDRGDYVDVTASSLLLAVEPLDKRAGAGECVYRIQHVRLHPGLGAARRPPTLSASTITAWNELFGAEEEQYLQGHGDGVLPPHQTWQFLDVPRVAYDSHAAVVRTRRRESASAAQSSTDGSAADTVPAAIVENLAPAAAAAATPPAVRAPVRHRVRFGIRSHDAAAAPRPARSRVAADAAAMRHALQRVTVDSQRSTLLSVLSSLLTGTRRRQMQDFIAAIGGLPALAQHFLQVNWLYDPGDTPYPRIHGPTCTCRPETEETIQLLRVAYCLHDRDCVSPVQRWLARRRWMTQRELSVAFTHYAAAHAAPEIGCSADEVAERYSSARVRVDADVPVDESSVLLCSLRSSPCRPWGWAAPANSSWNAVWHTVPEAAAPSHCARDAPGVAPVERPHLHIHDVVLEGRNAQGRAATDKLATDDGDIDRSIDEPCETSTIPETLLHALAKAMSVQSLAANTAELLPRPRGVISLMLCALVLSTSKAPYRTWLSSNIDSFLRAAPMPVRRWAAAHGLITFLVRALLDEHVLPRLQDEVASTASAAGAAKQDADHPSAKRRRRYIESRTDEPANANDLDDDDVSDAAGTEAGDTDPNACDDEEESEQRYAVESMFDLLGESVSRSREALRELEAAQQAWVDALPAAQRDKLASAGLRPDCGDVSALALLVGDRLEASVMFLRHLAVTEDWAHGLCETADTVTGADHPAAFADPVEAATYSWRNLAQRSHTLAAGAASTVSCDSNRASWYTAVDGQLLGGSLMQYLRNRRVPLLHALLMTVSLKRLSQDNLCVCTTALLFFVMAHRHGALPALVGELLTFDRQRMAADMANAERALSATVAPGAAPAPSKRKPDSVVPTLPPAQPASISVLPDVPSSSTPAPVIYAADGTTRIAHRLAKLAAFWLEYYSMRVRDRQSLRASTGYSYEEFRVVVRALLGLSVLSPAPPLLHALAHPFLAPETGEADMDLRTHDSTVDEDPRYLEAWTQQVGHSWMSPAEYWAACCVLRSSLGPSARE